MHAGGGFAVPFVRQLDGPMHPGRVLAVNGHVPPHGSRFVVNLQCGGAAASVSDIALHVSVRFEAGSKCVVRNSQAGPGGWQQEERDGGLPQGLRPGAPFQMMVRCEEHAYKIAFNGRHFRDFHHRFPYQRVTHVSAEGDVNISSVSGVMWAGGSAQQVYSPRVPHVQHIGSVYPGRCLRVRGVVPHDAYRFAVNLATGPSTAYDDICLHVSVRPAEGLVELNTCRRGTWESGQQLRPCPLRLNQAFELVVLVDDYGYKIAFNGVHFAEWPHRHPYQRVNHVIVDGSVRLELVSLEGQPRPGPPGGWGAPQPHYPSPYPQDPAQGGFFHNPYSIIH